MKKIHLSLLIPVFLLICCASCTSTTTTAPQTDTVATNIANAGEVWASLYQQRAAEYKALCFQAYNVAKLRLDMALAKHGKKPLAVITDIDETLLDNSPFDAASAIKNLKFDPRSWTKWTSKGICDTVPGAPSFFKYAASKGVEVFYITNRNFDEKPGTVKNLNLYNLPYVDSAHLMFKETSSSKEERRRKVLKNYDVVLYCGDNLPDFDMKYDRQPTEANRNLATQQLAKEFGSKYIVIPNMSYGDFSGAIFNYKYAFTDAQKDSVIRAKIKLDTIAIYR